MKHPATQAVTRVRIIAAAMGLRINRLPEDCDLPEVAQAETVLHKCAADLSRAILALDKAWRKLKTSGAPAQDTARVADSE